LQSTAIMERGPMITISRTGERFSRRLRDSIASRGLIKATLHNKHPPRERPSNPRVASAMNFSEKRTTATIGRFTPPRRQKRVGLTILGLLLLVAMGTGLSNGSGIIASLRATLSLEETTGALARGNATSLKFGDRIDYPAIASLTSKLDTPLAQKVILYEPKCAARCHLRAALLTILVELRHFRSWVYDAIYKVVL
jgi:hypothetical protein